MTRLLHRLLPLLTLTAALLFSQHAAMLHGLSHAEHELALATQGSKAPALGHGSDTCAAFGALASAIGNAAPILLSACTGDAAPSATFASSARPARIVFDSRAPPLS